MPSIQFGLSSYKRGKGDLPPVPVVNMVVEEAPTEDRQIVVQSRPGLSDMGMQLGSGPVRALFRRDGVLESALFSVSGDGFYQGVTRVGTMLGYDAASIAGNEIGVMATAGSELYFFDGATLSSVSFPDNADVAHVTTGGSRYWAVRKDTGKVYWTDALESDIEALDFATAESLPDRVLQTLWVDGGLVIFGSETVEFWQQTGDATLPIRPLINMVIEKGLRETGCATTIGPTFAWVTNEHQVCIQSEQNVVSNPGLQARIEASATCSLFTFVLDGDECLCLRIDGETQIYKPRSGMWSEFRSYGRSNWIVTSATSELLGTETGALVEWSSVFVDLGGVMERRLAFGFPINGGGVRVNNLRVRCNIGGTPFLSGDYAGPQVELRLSPDAGKTFDDWDAVSLGRQGEYDTLVEWRALGLASYPAFYGEVRVTDPVDFRVSDITVNEPGGGR